MSIEKENAELSRILKLPQTSSSTKRGNSAVRAIPIGMDFTHEEKEEKSEGKLCQWTTVDGTRFFPAGKTIEKLEPSLYECNYSVNQGYFVKKIDVKTEGLLRFPETNSEKVIHEIQTFWEREDRFKKHKLPYKRGIILWGPPGSGKSSTIKLVLADVINRGGVAFKFEDPGTFMECIRTFREIQSDTPIVVLMEDIDSIILDYSESEVLNILDGVEGIEKCVFLATTNYPEQLGERIINRPSRFDRRFKMPHPGKLSRKMYFEHLLEKELIDAHSIDINVWVEDTKGMSVAHLKELFVSVCILGDQYSETIQVLKTMIEEQPSSEDDSNRSVGFHSAVYKNEDD